MALLMTVQQITADECLGARRAGVDSFGPVVKAMTIEMLWTDELLLTVVA
jgi:hypothetical protein